MKSAIVVVELDPYRIEVHSAIEHRAVRRVRVRTLRCSCGIVFLRGIAGVIGPQLVCKGGHVVDSCLEVKIETVNYCVSEWSFHRGIGNWSECLPDHLGTGSCGCFVGKTAFIVSGSSDRKENCSPE